MRRGSIVVNHLVSQQLRGLREVVRQGDAIGCGTAPGVALPFWHLSAGYSLIRASSCSSVKADPAGASFGSDSA